MSTKEAYNHPAFEHVKYRPRWDLAEQVEKAVLDFVLEGRFEFEPGKFHNTEVISCPIRSGFERFMRHAAKDFEDANILFIGEVVHYKMAQIIPNTLAEEAFTEDDFDEDLVKRLRDRPNPLSLSFHVDIHRPEISPGSGFVYEVKTKESYKGLYDNVLLKYITIGNQTDPEVTPTSSYLNQLMPYIIVTKSSQGTLIYIPKLMFKNITAYETYLPNREAHRAIQETFVKRTEVLSDVLQRFENNKSLDLSLIEPSGVCPDACQFGRPKAIYKPDDGPEQQCPAYLLPTPTKITQYATPKLQDFYSKLIEAVTAKFEAAQLNFFTHFQWASVHRPDLVTLTAQEIQQATHVTDRGTAENYLHQLDEWGYTKFRVLEREFKQGEKVVKAEIEVVEVVPVRDMVRRGWGWYIFAPHFPIIQEAKGVADSLQNIMVKVVGEFIWQPYDYKGLFGCPRLQHFGNRGETNQGLTANPGQAKLWFVDMAIYESLTQQCCDPAMETAKFGKYTFRYYRFRKEFSPERRAVLWIPIYRTEWRNVSKPRKVPENPVITPLDKHIYQAATLAMILGIKAEVNRLVTDKEKPMTEEAAAAIVKDQIAKGIFPKSEPVFLGYYPRMKHGDIRLYEVDVENQVAMMKLGQESIAEIEQSIPIANTYRSIVEKEIQRIVAKSGKSQSEATVEVKQMIRKRKILPVFTCRWCPMRPWCQEGRDLLNFLDLTLTEEEESSAGTILRTF